MQDRRIERFKDTELTPLAAHDLTIRALDEHVICGSMVPKVLKKMNGINSIESTGTTPHTPRKARHRAFLLRFPEYCPRISRKV